jgi:hypothetical protein
MVAREHKMAKEQIVNVKNREKLPEYNSWHAMWRRVRGQNDPKHRQYYFDKGVKVCDRWKSFINFLNDLGYKPHPTYTLDRINTDKDYTPFNCRWASKRDQVLNRRISKNNKSGITGVHFDKNAKKYVAKFCSKRLGLFHCKEDAKVAYDKARRQYELTGVV